MKKLYMLLIIFLITRPIFAQQVGIGTLDPDASSALHIESNNKGVLIPKVNLSSLSDAAAIANPANSLLIYNTNSSLPAGTGFYYNAGSKEFPQWKTIAKLDLPYYGVANVDVTTFNIENYENNSTAGAIRGYGIKGPGVTGESGLGIGVLATSVGGNALEVDGKMKISGNGQTPMNGKVLTSDVDGNATWQGAVAFLASGVLNDGSEDILKNVETKVAFANQDYDIQGNYNDENGSPKHVFIAPVTGIYHFEAIVTWKPDIGQIDYNSVLALKLKQAAGSTTLVANEAFGLKSNSTQSVSTYCRLFKNDQVSVAISQSSFNSLSISTGSAFTRFGGTLILKQ